MSFLTRLFSRKEADSTQVEPVKSFYSRVVGVTFSNPDGTSRQEIIKRCKVGERLKLIHHPIPQDENAVKICRLNGQQLGHLSADIAIEISGLLDRRTRIDAEISEVTGGTSKKPIRGCNILIHRYK
jgi:hypothetical protein